MQRYLPFFSLFFKKKKDVKYQVPKKDDVTMINLRATVSNTLDFNKIRLSNAEQVGVCINIFCVPPFNQSKPINSPLLFLTERLQRILLIFLQQKPVRSLEIYKSGTSDQLLKLPDKSTFKINYKSNDMLSLTTKYPLLLFTLLHANFSDKRLHCLTLSKQMEGLDIS